MQNVRSIKKNIALVMGQCYYFIFNYCLNNKWTLFDLFHYDNIRSYNRRNSYSV